MCGIGGIYTASGNSLPLDRLRGLWEALEDRGGHAAGVGWLYEDSDRVLVCKGSGTASDAIRRGALKQVGEITRYAMLHTRFTTHGSVHQNGNNHPVVSQGIILTHNGVVSNHEAVFDELGCTRRHVVDTEAINAALRAGGPEEVYRLVGGSWSVAWVDVRESREVVNLMTNGNNPLVIGRTVEGNVVWGSNLYHLDSFDLKSHFNAHPYKVYTISEDAVIRSRFIDGAPQDEFPTILGQYSHAAAWGAIGTPSVRLAQQQRFGTLPSTRKAANAAALRGRKRAKSAAPGMNGWYWDDASHSWVHPDHSNVSTRRD